MLGLLILLFLAAYLAISVWVTFVVLKWAKTHQRSGWWAVLTAFVMYNLVFWDLIPTLAAHKYYCKTQAGFWVYKTPEEWMRENPEMRVLEYGEKKADDYSSERTSDGGNKTSFSTRATSNIKYTKLLNPLLLVTKNRKVEEQLFDVKNKELLVKRVAFQAGSISGAPNNLSDYKFWLNYGQCDGDVGNQDKTKWQKAFNEFLRLGE